MEITKYQRSLLEHAINEPGRNWFGTTLEDDDYIEFKKLVRMGLAIEHAVPSWMIDDAIFAVTEEGRRRYAVSKSLKNRA